MRLKGVLMLGLDIFHGPYIYHQYPPNIASPLECDASDHAPASSSSSTSNQRSLHSTIKSFAEIFLPRTELTGRACWLYEADTNYLLVYIAEEFQGAQYARNLMRFTIVLVFECPRWMTLSKETADSELSPFCIALLNISEELRAVEVKYNFVSQFMDPGGEYFTNPVPLTTHHNVLPSFALGGTTGVAATSRPKCVSPTSEEVTLVAAQSQASHSSAGDVTLTAFTTQIQKMQPHQPTMSESVRTMDGEIFTSTNSVVMGSTQCNNTNGVGGGLLSSSASVTMPGGTSTWYGQTLAIKGAINEQTSLNSFFLPSLYDRFQEESGLRFYDLHTVVEHIFYCLSGLEDAIPLSQHQSIQLSLVPQHVEGVTILPGMVCVPTCPPADVLMLTGDLGCWSDIALTDVFYTIDGSRTVKEIIEVFTGVPMEDSHVQYLASLQPTSAKRKEGGGCRRPSSVPRSSASQPPSSAQMAKGKGSFHHLPIGSHSSNGSPSESGLLTVEEKIVLEALQHLVLNRYIVLFHPIRPESVYTWAPALPSVLVEPNHPARVALGIRMLEVWAVLAREENQRQLIENQQTLDSLGHVTTNRRASSTDNAMLRNDDEGVEGFEVSRRKGKPSPQQQLKMRPGGHAPSSVSFHPTTFADHSSGSSTSTSASSSRSHSPTTRWDDERHREEWTHVSRVLNAASLHAASNEPCFTEDEISQSLSAALSGLATCQFSQLKDVQASMRHSTVWGAMFDGWAYECCAAMVEFALLNNWLLEDRH